MRKCYDSKKSFSYEIYAETSKAAHKVLQQRGASSIREFSPLDLHNLQFFAQYDGLRLGVSSTRDESCIRCIMVVVEASFELSLQRSF